MRTPEDFEDTLRHVLRREAAPPDFAARVMARVEMDGRVDSKVVVMPWWRTRAALAAAAGLLIAAIVPAGYVEHRRMEQRRQEQALEARRQLVVALQITRSKLQLARHQVQRKHS